MNHKFNYKWNLKDAIFTKDKGKVFSCFACGGGSTMGYKLAGFDVLGCNEIDPKMIEAYRLNHNPKYSYLEPIQEFKNRKDLPRELYELDILDGSPPCSSFSISGNREKDWGKEKKFREGQSKQVLDTLFFDFIDLAKELQPKIVIAENVKGLLMGKAKEYVKKIYDAFDLAGYFVQHHLLDASKMGVPQRRQRVFFIAMRKDLASKFTKIDSFSENPKLKLEFKEPPIFWREIKENIEEPKLTKTLLEYWENRKDGDIDLSGAAFRLKGITSCFNNKFLFDNKVSNTVTGGEKCVLWDIPRMRTNTEIIKCSTFPADYNFNGMKSGYMCGMSVPPIMTARIATEIYNQWNQIF
jgi:DNA (cytosine-5)-methyltransferase 1